MSFKLKALSVAVTLGLTISANAQDLMDIYKEALQRDPVVLQAKADADAAHAGVSEATAALLPQIDVVGSLTRTRTNVSALTGYNSNNRNAQASVTLSQQIWHHSTWANRSVAEKTATYYDIAYANAMQSLIIRVSNAYFNVLNAVDTLKYEKANNAALKRQLDEADRRLNVGLIAETDKLQAQAAYDLSNASVIAAENDLTTSYEDIRALIGHSITADDLAKLDESKFSTPAVKEQLARLIKLSEENNLSLQQALVQRDIARDNITVAQSGHEPTLDLNASANTGDTHYNTQIANSSQMNGNSWNQSVGLQLNIPIFHGGATSAAVDKAQAQYIKASEQLEQQHRTLISDVNNNFNNVNAAISSVRAYKNSVTSADAALKATQAGYNVGTRTMTDVLDATQNLYSAMQKSAKSRYDYILSRLSLLYTQGDLKVEHIDQVNGSLK